MRRGRRGAGSTRSGSTSPTPRGRGRRLPIDWDWATVLSLPEARSIALGLRDAELTGGIAANPSRVCPTLDWADARLIAQQRDAIRRDEGDTPIGYKLGWTSAAMREALGIDR